MTTSTGSCFPFCDLSYHHHHCRNCKIYDPSISILTSGCFLCIAVYCLLQRNCFCWRHTQIATVYRYHIFIPDLTTGWPLLAVAYHRLLLLLPLCLLLAFPDYQNRGDSVSTVSVFPYSAKPQTYLDNTRCGNTVRWSTPQIWYSAEVTPQDSGKHLNRCPNGETDLSDSLDSDSLGFLQILTIIIEL